MAVLKYYDTTTSSWQYIAASTTANFTTWKKTMSGGETSVSGSDDSSVTLSYTVGLEQVFINGALQARGSDYVATTGTSVTGLSALSANDIVSVVCYAPFNVANTIAPTLVDAKGDLIAGTAADVVGRLAVGTNRQVLVADSTASTGLKWDYLGLNMIVPTSVAVGSGTASINTAGQVSFSSASSVSLNGCFSSTYDNYRILINLSAITVDGSSNIKLRASGTDAATGYNYNGIQVSTSTATGDSQTAQSSFPVMQMDAASSGSYHIYNADMYNPFLSVQTGIIFTSRSFTGSGSALFWNYGGYHGTSSSYDGFTLTLTGATTGTIAVYGYKN